MKYVRISLFIAWIITLQACNTRPKNHEEEPADWKELDEFHMIMAEAFHPYRDSGNLQPAFRYAAQLDSLADAWNEASLPSKVDNDAVKANLSALREETGKLSDLVALGDTTQVGASLTHLHDLFHGLQEAWYAGGARHHEEE